MCVCLASPEIMLAAAWARWPRPLRTLGPPAIGQLWLLRSFTWSPPLGDSVQGASKKLTKEKPLFSTLRSESR